MDIVKTWLLVGAERREFDGVVSRAKAESASVSELNWPGVKFACAVAWRDDRWLLVANGPGPGLVTRALETRRDVDGIVSTGFCGALDPALRIGEIVVSGDIPFSSDRHFTRGRIHTANA